jgi:YVTN family beta-propeller protein
VVNDLSTSDSVSPVDTGTQSAGSPVAVGSLPLGIAITPDARTAYVVNAGATGATGQITPLDLATSPPSAEASIDIPNSPGNFIAISPDGRKAYMSDPRDGRVFPIDLTTSPATPGTAIDVAGNPEGIAFSPDGRTAYVAQNANTGGAAEVIPINVATDTPGTPIVGVGPHPFAIAITPSGTKAYVTDAGGGSNGKVYPITLASATVGTAITVGGSEAGITIPPDGSTAYVTNGSSVTPITLSDNSVGTPITLSGGAYAVASTPDSKTVYATNDTGDTVTPIATATNTAGTPISVGATPRGIAVTPDQGPAANFTVTSAPPGSPSSFDASSSTVAFGSIALYEWNFGDGSPLLTTGEPTATHVYASAGSYTASVTEADGLGTSASGELFTGQTASIFGNPLATTSKSVVISSAAQPTVSLSTSSLGFGTLGVGQRATQTLKISNTGKAPLRIASSSLGGLGASAFSSGPDGCTAATLPVGGSCTVRVTFAPLSGGVFDAQLAFTDDASGSPHILTLSGTATTSGGIAGTVTSSSGTSAPAPLAGVSILLCHPGLLECSTSSAAANGAYSIGNLAPGAYHIEFYPPAGSPDLNAAINVNVSAGPAIDVSPVLHPPRHFPTGVSISTPGGRSYQGIPAVYGNQPFQMNFPFNVDPAASALKPAPPSPCVYSVLTVSLEFSTAPGVNGGQTYSYSGTQKLVMVYDQNGPRGYTFETEAGNYLLTPTTQVVDQALAGGGDVTWSIVGGGASLQVSFSGAEAIFGASGFQVHGVIRQHADFKNAWSCEVEGGGEDEGEGEQEIDPSGFVRSSTGIPLANAKVTLQREGPASRFTAPVSGDHSVFDPAINPELSDQLGHYGWNVVPGHYRTTVSHAKCKSVVSPTVAVPPPVTNLSVQLRCRGLRRGVSAISAKVLGKPRANGGALLQLSVRSHGSTKPQGEVRLSTSGHVLSVPVNAHGVALLAVAGLTAGNHLLQARYLGDATHAPAAVKARVRVLPALPRKPLPGKL